MKDAKIPYGISDFELIRRCNYYYVDKTGFIPLIEAAGRTGETVEISDLFFLSP